MTTEIDAVTVTSIISNINGLYNNLVSYTVGLILFVGAFVPAVISFFQRRQFRAEHEDLTQKFLLESKHSSEQMEKRILETLVKLQSEEFQKIKKINEETEKQLKREIRNAKGGLFHLQAQQFSEMPEVCLSNCDDALMLYLSSDDEKNGRSILNVIDNTLEKIAKNKPNNTELEDIYTHLTNIVKTLGDHNTNGRYGHDVERIERWLKVTKDAQKPT